MAIHVDCSLRIQSICPLVLLVSPYHSAIFNILHEQLYTSGFSLILIAIMLAPSRRCSALLARTLSSAAIAPRAQRASFSLLTSPAYGSRAVIVPLTARYLHGSSRAQREAVARRSEPAAEEYESGHEAEVEGIETFSQLGDRGLAHPNVIKAITQDMAIDGMTEVQAATIQGALKGTDM